MTSPDWKTRLDRFFYDRAVEIKGVPTLFDHAVVSGKDPRLSARPEIHRALVDSIFVALKLNATAQVLEVGCASGYIAAGLAPTVKKYTGIDLSVKPLEVARQMKLPNAEFLHADGGAIPFPNEIFDGVFANDVLVNFPTFGDCEPLLREMVRVVKPGGRVLIGSVTDKNKDIQFAERVRVVAAELEAQYGPPFVPKEKKSFPKFLHYFRSDAAHGVKPEAITYSFDLENFTVFAQKAAVEIEIEDVFLANPYHGYRVNIILTKPAR